MLDSRKIGHWKNETNRFKASTKHSMNIIPTNTPQNLTKIWKSVMSKKLKTKTKPFLFNAKYFFVSYLVAEEQLLSI